MNKKFELLIKWTYIKIINISICKYCSDSFPLYDLEKTILDMEWFSYPDFCPTCRFRMMYTYINDKHLYNRKSTKTGENIVSVISDDYEWIVLKAEDYKQMILNDEFLNFKSDIWNNIFTEFKNQYKLFPKPSKLIYPELENAEFTSHSGWAKNIYMSFWVFVNVENIFNSFYVFYDCRNVFSSYYIIKSSNIYDSWLINSSFEISFSYNIKDSSNLIFCRNMQNSFECMFCCNQINSKYKIYNKQYSKPEYEIIKKSILQKMSNYFWFKILENEYRIFLNSNLIEVSSNIVNSESVVWEKVSNSKNSINVYNIWDTVENCVNLIESGGWKNIINSVACWLNSENIIWSCSAWVNSYWVYFCFACVENCNNIYYCVDLESCNECMFCFWLKNKKYYIFNKKYSKEQYFQEKEKIILEMKIKWNWGDFLWFDFSYFPYNDTLSYDFFKVHSVINFDWTVTLIDKNAKWIVTIFENKFISNAELDLWGEEKIQIKWRTKDKEINIPEWINVILPWEKIDYNNSEDILLKAIICEISWRPFKLIKAELDYIMKKWFPIPRIHPELRLEKLISIRPIWQLFVWKSDKSWMAILSVFVEKWWFRVYSPEEYREFMFS